MMRCRCSCHDSRFVVVVLILCLIVLPRRLVVLVVVVVLVVACVVAAGVDLVVVFSCSSTPRGSLQLRTIR